MVKMCIDLSEKQAKLLKIVAVVELSTDIELAKKKILEGLEGRVDDIGTSTQDELKEMLGDFRKEEKE